MVSQMVVPDSSDRGRRSFSELIQCSYDSALAFVKAMGTYTPLVMREWFTLYPEPPSGPMHLSFSGAVLFLDISGFTQLCNRYVSCVESQMSHQQH